MYFKKITKPLEVIELDAKGQFIGKSESKFDFDVLRLHPNNIKKGIAITIETAFSISKESYKGKIETMFADASKMKFEDFDEITKDSIESYVREFYIRTGNHLIVQIPYDLVEQFQRFEQR